MKTYTFEGKNLEELTLQALKELNVKEDEMLTDVKEETVGLLRKKKYTLNVILKSDVLEYAKKLLKDIVEGMGIKDVIIPALIIITTFVSQKFNKTAPTPQKGDINPNMMSNMMIIMIAVLSINFSVALSLYWIASTLFTIVQNLIAMQIKKKKKAN